MNKTLSRALTVLALLGGVGFAQAQPQGDPPTRAGRVADLQGEAWVFDAEAHDWQRLDRNQTVAEGDRIRTERGARLSLRVGSTSLWLDESSDLELSRLGEDRAELLLARGQLGLRLRRADAVNDFQVLTREGRFAFEGTGLYRIDQLDRGSRAANWDGRLRFDSRSAGAAPVWLLAGEQAEFWWAEGARTERLPLARDFFGDWLQAQNRLEGEGDALAYRYVSPEMTGAEDLDRYGRWEQSEDYGSIWVPVQVASDWVPYQYGHWAWTRLWGWTWVDDMPWGFAPFHYGRWVHHRGHWCWAPGRYVARPVYAPALVAWVGAPSVGVSVTIGARVAPSYGWVPLAPRESYQPGYRYSPGYLNRLNRDTDPVGVRVGGGLPYRNGQVAGAVSVLPQGQARPSVWRDTLFPLKALPQAPARQDWQAVPAARDAGATLPQRQAQPVWPTDRLRGPAVQPSLEGPAAMPWRREPAIAERETPERQQGAVVLPQRPVREAVPAWPPQQQQQAVQPAQAVPKQVAEPGATPWRRERVEPTPRAWPQAPAEPMPQTLPQRQIQPERPRSEPVMQPRAPEPQRNAAPAAPRSDEGRGQPNNQRGPNRGDDNVPRKRVD